jgi:VanZ family protein
MSQGEDGPSLALRGACLAAAAALVFQLFSLGAQPAAGGLFQAPWDKLAHFCFFSLLTVLLWKAAAGRVPLAVIAVVILVGGLDELRQAGIPGRFASMADFLVDAGAAACTGVMMVLLDARGGAGPAAQPRPAQH